MEGNALCTTYTLTIWTGMLANRHIAKQIIGLIIKRPPNVAKPALPSQFVIKICPGRREKYVPESFCQSTEMRKAFLLIGRLFIHQAGAVTRMSRIGEKALFIRPKSDGGIADKKYFFIIDGIETVFKRVYIIAGQGFFYRHISEPHRFDFFL